MSEAWDKDAACEWLSDMLSVNSTDFASVSDIVWQFMKPDKQAFMDWKDGTDWAWRWHVPENVFKSKVKGEK